MDADVELLQLRNEIFERLARNHAENLERFGEVDVKLARIDEHTTATNGAIARHDREILILSRHPLECPMRDRVAHLELAEASATGGGREVSAWKKRAQPWFLLSAGGASALILRLILVHGSELVK